MYRALLALLISAALTRAALGWPRTHSFPPEDYPGCLFGASVVYGTVLGAEKTGPFTSKLDVRIEATIGGDLVNPLKASRLFLEFNPGDVYAGELIVRDGAARVAPPPAAHILALLTVREQRSVDRTPGEFQLGTPFAPEWQVPFMPHEAAIVRVSGFDDPMVGAVLARLRKCAPFTIEKIEADQPRTFNGSEPGFWELHALEVPGTEVPGTPYAIPRFQGHHTQYR
jgi:hypothetical protein